MHTQNLAVNQRCQGQIVEYLSTIFPSVGVSVFLLAFIIKTVYLRNLSALVVPSEECNFVRVPRNGRVRLSPQAMVKNK